MTPTERKRIDKAQQDEALDEAVEHEDIQHGVDQSIPKQEQLRRAVRQHPQRDFPRVESIEPAETPPRV